jgi:hypothetical protein
MLAYYFLWREAPPSGVWNVRRLDDQIESFLQAKTGLSLNFEVSDAVGKLFRLGLAHRDRSGTIRAIPIDEALQTLDRRWDGTFTAASKP